MGVQAKDEQVEEKRRALLKQSQLKDYQRDAEADRALNEQLALELKVVEKKLKTYKADMIQLSYLLQDEKRRLDARIQQLDEELEEEQSNLEIMMDKVRKAQGQIEQLTNDIISERSNS
ncbi:hypothetical protein NPIL_302191 [Nephila pilipes]|uniref:Myosin tail domain-containing protein n=1 Tax=Nephila pilipes TaxID=299642 RepID=A0A8X6R8D9_NEPPI|nr:hypothetical protein NPIL_302191 [Nephila pilipes]